MENKNTKSYEYKMDKMEKNFSFIMLIIFLVTIKGTLGFIIYMGISLAVFAYYFAFYKKKPSYICINGNEITASQGLFFRTKSFQKSDIDNVAELENKIEVKLKNGGRISLFKNLLSENDYEEIKNELAKWILKKSDENK